MTAEDQARRQLKALRETTTLRDLAARIGISHFAVYQFLEKKKVRPATLERIQAWLAQPGEEDSVVRFRNELRRLLGRLGAAKKRELERSIGRLIEVAFHEAGEDVPTWVKQLGRKQV